MKEENYKSIPLKYLLEAKWNYKTDNVARQKKLVNNIKINGQIENIIVRELSKGMFEVINGNHRLRAFIELNFKDVMCFNLGKIDLNKAKKIAFQTNEIKFEKDIDKFRKLISDIESDTKELLETTDLDKSLLEYIMETESINEELIDNLKEDELEAKDSIFKSEVFLNKETIDKEKFTKDDKKTFYILSYDIKFANKKDYDNCYEHIDKSIINIVKNKGIIKTYRNQNKEERKQAMKRKGD